MKDKNFEKKINRVLLNEKHSWEKPSANLERRLNLTIPFSNKKQMRKIALALSLIVVLFLLICIQEQTPVYDPFQPTITVDLNVDMNSFKPTIFIQAEGGQS